MPLTKKFLKSRPEVKVTFEIDQVSACEAQKVDLIAEFEHWVPLAMPRLKSGNFKTTLNVPTHAQTEFQFCYRLTMVDGNEIFINDPHADGYCQNPYGGENSLLRVVE